MSKKILLILLGLILLIGIIYSLFIIVNKNEPIICDREARLCPNGSTVGRIEPNCEFAQCPLEHQLKEFNQPITMQVNDKIIFSDGLSLVLKKINDSRCKPDVQCIWQGELSAVLLVKNNDFSEEINLGTVNNKSIVLKDYGFSLLSATENSTIIMVSFNLIGANTNGITGYIHMGPTCPVEKYPSDPNCADKPVTNANINIIIKSSGFLVDNTKSDANGNFLINIVPGTYTITVHSQTNNFLPRCEEKEAIVTINNFTKLDISCDTGIR